MADEKRVFIAMELNSVHRENLKESQRRLAKDLEKGYIVPEENFHMTLAFLGEQSAEAMHRILDAMLEVAVQTPIFLTYMGNLGEFTFPKGATYFMGIRSTKELLSLEESLKDALGRRGFPIEERPFHPHITLVKKGKLLPQSEGLEAMNEKIHMPKLPILVDKLILFESIQDGEDTRYESLHVEPLVAKRQEV